MKYRRLTLDELKDLEKEFVRFLATHQITADDWVKLKADNYEKAEELIEIFSDLVIGSTLEKLEYLEYKTPYDIKTFHCQKDKITLMGISVAEDSGVDFTRDNSHREMIEALKKSGKDIQIYTAEKTYILEREEELFSMLQSGCLISKEGLLYKALYSLKKEKES